jgi:hypothetical protein
MGMKHNENNELIPLYMEELSKVTIPFLFFFLSSVFISAFYYKGIQVSCGDYLMSTLFYVSFPFLFINQLGVIRQGMACAVVFCAISLYHEKIHKRIILLIIACLCHQSAIVGFLILLPWNRIKGEFLFVLLLISIMAGTVLMPIFERIINMGFLNEIGTDKAINYLTNDSAGEGRLIRYLVYIIGLFVLVNYKKLVRFKPENSYYVGLLILGVALFAIFSYNISLAKRLSMFFFSTAIIVVPDLFKVLKLPRALCTTMCILLLAITVYVGSGNHRDEDPPGYSVTYPYRTIFGVLDN